MAYVSFVSGNGLPFSLPQRGSDSKYLVRRITVRWYLHLRDDRPGPRGQSQSTKETLMSRLLKIVALGLALDPRSGGTAPPPTMMMKKAHEKDGRRPIRPHPGRQGDRAERLYGRGDFLKGAALEEGGRPGKVIKVSAAIMDRNWIHLRDGSGDPAKGTHNLVVASGSSRRRRDGQRQLAKDRGFGSGYLYAARGGDRQAVGPVTGNRSRDRLTAPEPALRRPLPPYFTAPIVNPAMNRSQEERVDHRDGDARDERPGHRGPHWSAFLPGRAPSEPRWTPSSTSTPR